MRTTVRRQVGLAVSTHYIDDGAARTLCGISRLETTDMTMWPLAVASCFACGGLHNAGGATSTATHKGAAA